MTERETPGYFYFADAPGVAIPWQHIARMLNDAGHDVMAQPGFRRIAHPLGYVVVETATIPDTGEVARWTVGATVHPDRESAEALAAKIRDDDTAPLHIVVTVHAVAPATTESP